jgi:hypothetical protein
MVMKLGDVEDVIAGITVCITYEIRNDPLPDDRKESVLADIGDHHGVDSAAALEDSEDGDLAGCAATALAFPNAAKIALIDLDEPFDGQAVLQLLCHELAQPMKEIGPLSCG